VEADNLVAELGATDRYGAPWRLSLGAAGAPCPAVDKAKVVESARGAKDRDTRRFRWSIEDEEAIVVDCVEFGDLGVGFQWAPRRVEQDAPLASPEMHTVQYL
jgi:hypothetical protein